MIEKNEDVLVFTFVNGYSVRLDLKEDRRNMGRFIDFTAVDQKGQIARWALVSADDLADLMYEYSHRVD